MISSKIFCQKTKVVYVCNNLLIKSYLYIFCKNNQRISKGILQVRLHQDTIKIWNIIWHWPLLMLIKRNDIGCNIFFKNTKLISWGSMEYASSKFLRFILKFLWSYYQHIVRVKTCNAKYALYRLSSFKNILGQTIIQKYICFVSSYKVCTAENNLL